MRQDYTHITFVLDRSGSMNSIWNDVQGSFNQFVKDQNSQPGYATFSLYIFDDFHDRLADFVDLTTFAGLPLNVKPRGSTALLDAIGRSIIETGNRLSIISLLDRPSKVVFVVQTDGYENASREFTFAKISEIIRHQTDNYNWQFVFLGANIDAIASASQVGINPANSVNYAASSIGTKSVYDVLSGKISSYRVGGCSGMAFTPEEKREVEQHVDQTNVPDPFNPNPLNPDNFVVNP